jgi:cyanophycinase
MIRRFAVSAVFVTLAFGHPVTAQQLGPKNGSLVIVGGAMRDQAIVEKFIELAGGPNALIVIIPTAGGGDDDDYNQDCRCLRQFRNAGARNLRVLHTYDRDEAQTDAFVRPIREAGGVWFGGGRQWRLADSYLNTKTHEELWALLDRDGVIGGSSAGATIQGSYLARGDTRTNTIMMGDHQQGLAFVKNVAIDQHVLRRNRQFDLLEITAARPDLLGIGIDENTAIVVHGDEFEIIGESYVLIYDNQRQIDSGGDFYFLGAGDRFNLATREALRGERSIERVVERR